MANDMIVHRSHLPATEPADRRLSRELTRQVDHMQFVAELAKAAMNEASETTGYAAYKAESTLNFVDMLRQTQRGRSPSPTEQAANDYRTQLYLNALNDILDSANSQLLRSVDQASLHDGKGSVLDQIMRDLFGE